MAELIEIDEPDSRPNLTIPQRNLELSRIISSRHLGDDIRRIERVDADPSDPSAFYGWRFFIA